jgi:hypothetical protein
MCFSFHFVNTFKLAWKRVGMFVPRFNLVVPELTSQTQVLQHDAREVIPDSPRDSSLDTSENRMPVTLAMVWSCGAKQG